MSESPTYVVPIMSSCMVCVWEDECVGVGEWVGERMWVWKRTFLLPLH